jgi:hypothetical protein
MGGTLKSKQGRVPSWVRVLATTLTLLPLAQVVIEVIRLIFAYLDMTRRRMDWDRLLFEWYSPRFKLVFENLELLEQIAQGLIYAILFGGIFFSRRSPALAIACSAVAVLTLLLYTVAIAVTVVAEAHMIVGPILRGGK